MSRSISAFLISAAFVSFAAAAPGPRLVAGPLEIDIPDTMARCDNYMVFDQDLARPGVQIFVNVFEESANNYKFADGSLKCHLSIKTTGAENPNGHAEVIAETRGCFNKFCQTGKMAFVDNGLLLVPGKASEAGAGNMPTNIRLTVFTINYEGQNGCSRAPLEEVQYAHHGECIADFNGDGGIDGSDMYDFYQAWEHFMPTADMNGDLVIDQLDVAAFFGPWENGGC